MLLFWVEHEPALVRSKDKVLVGLVAVGELAGDHPLDSVLVLWCMW